MVCTKFLPAVVNLVHSYLPGDFKIVVMIHQNEQLVTIHCHFVHFIHQQGIRSSFKQLKYIFYSVYIFLLVACRHKTPFQVKDESKRYFSYPFYSLPVEDKKIGYVTLAKISIIYQSQHEITKRIQILESIRPKNPRLTLRCLIFMRFSFLICEMEIKNN